MLNIYAFSALKILSAAIIGGIIGIERESVKRPAGFRTHILVCVAAAMIMDINILMALDYPNIDPARMGAQVISGMGFLGAGTIIKEGASVKGLTTAASLWAVACIGLTVGSGHIAIAVMAMFIMLLTLKTFSNLEDKFTKDHRIVSLVLQTDASPDRIGVITVILGSYNCKIIALNIEAVANAATNKIYITYELPHSIKNDAILKKLRSTTGVLEVTISETYPNVN